MWRFYFSSRSWLSFLTPLTPPLAAHLILFPPGLAAQRAPGPTSVSVNVFQHVSAQTFKPVPVVLHMKSLRKKSQSKHLL